MQSGAISEMDSHSPLVECAQGARTPDGGEDEDVLVGWRSTGLPVGVAEHERARGRVTSDVGDGSEGGLVRYDRRRRIRRQKVNGWVGEDCHGARRGTRGGRTPQMDAAAVARVLRIKVELPIVALHHAADDPNPWLVGAHVECVARVPPAHVDVRGNQSQ